MTTMTKSVVPLQDIYGLSDTLIGEKFPAIFQTHAHESRSDRYRFYPTWTILAMMRKNGFVPTFVTQARTRTEGMEEYTKHWMIFRHAGVDFHKVGDTIYEISLLNSHGGQSSLLVEGMVVRLVCLNGMKDKSRDASLKVYHKNNMVDEVLSAVQQTVLHSSNALQWVELLKHVQLDTPERMLLEQTVIAARLGADLEHSQVINGEFRVLEDTTLDGGKKRIAKVYHLADFTHPRRPEDNHNNQSIWMESQRLEENLRRGGQQGVTISDDGQQRKTKLKATHGIDGMRNTQELVSQMASKFYELKTGKSLREAVGVNV